MRKKKVLEKPVAILGGGACAQTFAAEFTLAGYKVRLFELPEFAAQSLGDVLKNHEIELYGEQRNFKWFRRAGTAKVDVVTTNISEAIKGAGLVIVAIPAKGLKQFFAKMIPHLENGQVISIFPNNFGALMLRNMLREKKNNPDIIIGGWSSMPYGVRLDGPGKLDCIARIHSIMWDTLPSKDGDKYIEIMKQIPPFEGVVEIKRGDTIVGVDLSNPNPVVHVPGSILNVGAMEVSEMEGTLGIPKGKYSMYKYGMSPSVSHVQFAFYKEEVKIAEAMNIKIAKHQEDQFYWKGGVMGFEYWVPYGDVILPPIVGPNSVEHRYFTEDIPVGTVVRYNLAKKFNVDVPIIESMIRIGSVVCRQDFFKNGISLKELGLENLNRDQIIQYLREGRI
ncbi:MAG: NAD/NADP octopine/nopaline dehydrogenase family protein [Verrucomicrobia bacterium]|nr:NAD/NADP octopine/nopaline dehydrogenase family protein [Verrucomicrobiota bacterium]MBU4291998.1 NAD/NADP octopine/nopaline dehydrogenase family protein [Verrucomicrobiota bacterium]MBU4427885.1 NAD/NADP octopine/nopaline dehydrogenase family protein [Verrucomicrobiota bacterium]MCG2678832.1 NAD/NADP octopine/nopaline dehydrogenase family protein [Kiritimatiellia bacterium]